MLANDRSTWEDAAIRRSSVARSWTWSRPGGRSPRSLRRWDQRPVDLHLASPGPHRPGLLPGLSSLEKEELAAARRRIAQLETELAVTRRAAELLKEQAPPFDRVVRVIRDIFSPDFVELWSTATTSISGSRSTSPRSPPTCCPSSTSTRAS